MKLSLVVCFSLCLLLVVFGSGSSEFEFHELESSSLSPNPNEDSKCSVKCEDFKALETRNGEQGKLLEKFIEQVKLLSEKLNQLEKKVSEDDGLSMLTPRLRGPPGKDGKQGEKGDRGLVGPEGRKGESGRNGEAGQNGRQGERGSIGQGGQKGEQGPPGPKGERGLSAAQSIKTCSVAMETLPSPRSKKQTIFPHGNTNNVEVLCDFETDGGGWTIIQKRSRGPREEFNQNWNEYVKGFGSVDKNFWIGLDNIHALTKNGDQELRIELEDFEGNQKYAKYSSFSVSGASDFYRLAISGYSGTAGDSMTNANNGYRFSTKDKDHDNCIQHGGPWWRPAGCTHSGLNGLYKEKGETIGSTDGIGWYYFKHSWASLAKSEMKVRPRKS